MPPGRSPFRSAAYRYLFIGSALTMSAYFMQNVAQGWLIYDLTGSSTWLGIVSFASGIPMLLLGLPGGVIVDRMDRRLVLIVSQGVSAFLALVLTLLIVTDVVQPWHVVVCVFLSGCFVVLIVPARQALLPATVERSQFGAAIGLLSAGQNSGRVIGPAVVGVMLAVFGAAMAFAAQAVGFLGALVCAVLMRPRLSEPRARRTSPLQSALEGLRFIWGDPTASRLIALQAVPALLLMPYVQLVPVFARDILGAGPDGLGTLMTVNGIGSVLGSVGVIVLPGRRLGLALIAALGLFALAIVAFALCTSYPLAIALMGVVGVAQAVYLATNNTVLQLAVPDALQGRVMSIYIMTWGLMPLGALPQGILADLYGAPLVVAAAGLLGFLFVVAMAARSPEIRRT